MKDDAAASDDGELGRSDLDWPFHAGAVDRVLAAIDIKVQERRRRSRQRAMAASAAVAVFLMGVAGRLSVQRDSDSSRSRSASAIVSAPARQVLSDGSRVELKEGGRITVEFTLSVRRVVLHSGEAHFQVTKNAERPFIVRAGGVDVRAVGTAFSVQLGQDAVDVVVTEGEVAVDQPLATVATQAHSSPAPRTLASLTAGNRIVVELASAALPSPVARPVSEEELMDRLAWRVPKLEFSATPLAEAVPLINQYGRVTLEIGDAALGRVELSGVLRADNLDTLLGLLARDHGIRAERDGEDRIVLRRGTAAAQ